MGMEIEIDQWEWEGMGTLIVLPHTSSLYRADCRRWLVSERFWRRSSSCGLNKWSAVDWSD